ncbi:soluble guanylate cyclase gcy, partial [Clonorchis sinensis]
FCSTTPGYQEIPTFIPVDDTLLPNPSYLPAIANAMGTFTVTPPQHLSGSKLVALPSPYSPPVAWLTTNTFPFGQYQGPSSLVPSEFLTSPTTQCGSLLPSLLGFPSADSLATAARLLQTYGVVDGCSASVPNSTPSSSLPVFSPSVHALRGPSLNGYTSSHDFTPHPLVDECSMTAMSSHARYWSGGSTDSALTESFASIRLHSSVDDRLPDGIHSPVTRPQSCSLTTSNSVGSAVYCVPPTFSSGYAPNSLQFLCFHPPPLSSSVNNCFTTSDVPSSSFSSSIVPNGIQPPYSNTTQTSSGGLLIVGTTQQVKNALSAMHLNPRLLSDISSASSNQTSSGRASVNTLASHFATSFPPDAPLRLDLIQPHHPPETALPQTSLGANRKFSGLDPTLVARLLFCMLGQSGIISVFVLLSASMVAMDGKGVTATQLLLFFLSTAITWLHQRLSQMVLSLYKVQSRKHLVTNYPVHMVISAELYRVRILSVFKHSYRSAIDRCYSVDAVQSMQDRPNPYLLKTHWTDASELAGHLFERIVAVNEHFVVVDKPAGLSVWGHALSKLEALKLLRPKVCLLKIPLSIKDCLPHLCKLIDDASSTGTFSQNPVYTFSHSPDGMNPPTSLSSTMPKLYIAESLPASYSGLILLGRTQEYTTAAQKFYRAALKGKPPWRMYQQFLAVCLNKPFTLCAENVRFPVGTFALNEHLHVGYRVHALLIRALLLSFCNQAKRNSIPNLHFGSGVFWGIRRSTTFQYISIVVTSAGGSLAYGWNQYPTSVIQRDVCLFVSHRLNGSPRRLTMMLILNSTAYQLVSTLCVVVRKVEGDCLVRPLDMVNSGPEFLKLGEQQWPKTDIEQFHHKPTDPELKRAATVLVTATTDLPTDVLFSYYSSWVRLRRAVAWFTRFKSYLHSKLFGKGIELKNTLRLEELNEAERSVLRYVRLKAFPSELSTTSTLDSKTCKGLCRKSPICKLHPIVLNGHKWTNLRRNVRVGDLVLILGEQHTRGTWSKGVVTATIPGSDGCVRTVVLKTPDGSVTKDIRKVWLDSQEEAELKQSIGPSWLGLQNHGHNDFGTFRSQYIISFRTSGPVR